VAPFFWYAMNKPLEHNTAIDCYAAAWENPPVVIIGAGPVGQRVAAEFLQQSRQKPVPVVLFGDEPRELYDRVQLSGYLAGDIPSIVLTDQLDNEPQLTRCLGVQISAIDRDRRVVIDGNGNACPWSRLVLATGSRATVPGIPGVTLENVYRFRDLDDAEQLMARTVRSRHTIVIGGGLLGLEAARAMRRFNTRVTVLEQAAHLMFHQLDTDGAALLNNAVHRLGIEVISNARVKQFCGSMQVEAVELADGRCLPCDTVVLATGITPNIELARECGLHSRRGILVDDQMRSSDPYIFAAGECAEHRNRVYGLVAPGYEQAAVVAHALARHTVSYNGSSNATRLKVVGCNVFSVGEIQLEWHRRSAEYIEGNGNIYRKLFLVGNRLDAAYALGTWQDASRIQEAVRKRHRIWPWQLKRFRRTGSLWHQDADDSVAGWPATATVCNCKAITRGTLSRAVDQGCRDIGSLCEATGAATVCGSCRPLLQQLLGAVHIEPVRAAAFLTTAAVLAGLVGAMILLLPAIPYNRSVQSALQWDALWRNDLLKQASGFSLLGLSLCLAFLSLPKRIHRIDWGDFGGWRAAHAGIGLLVALLLLAHTGLRLGNELNLLLMLAFLGTLLSGALLSATSGRQHTLPLGFARRARRLSVWSHILLLWPLPALLGFHVLKTYWF
jgi:nitrite reductase (NADH) large subunit